MVNQSNTAENSNDSSTATRAPLLQSGALHDAIFKSANFSCIATDARGVIQIFNVGAEHMLGYQAGDVINRITPADISDPQEIINRAGALSTELATPIAAGSRRWFRSQHYAMDKTKLLASS